MARDFIVQYQWFITAGVGILALMIGALLRGMAMGRRIRRAEVERDVVRTELDQARAEIDGLYMAQRRSQDAKAGESTQALKEQIRANDALIKSLGDDLARARTEVESLTRQKQAASDGQPVEPQETLSDITLIWRNRYLESRVRVLEVDATDRQPVDTDPDQMVPASPLMDMPTETGPEQAPETQAEAVADDGLSGVDVEAAKLRWQREYLRQRVTVLEENAISAAHASVAGPVAEATPLAAPMADEPVEAVTEPPAPVPETEDTPDKERAEPAKEAETDLSDPAQIEQELAKLRWRTRYLEGRLAYLSADAEALQAEEVDAVVEDIIPEAEEDTPEDEVVKAIQEIEKAASVPDTEPGQPVSDNAEPTSVPPAGPKAESSAEAVAAAGTAIAAEEKHEPKAPPVEPKPDFSADTVDTSDKPEAERPEAIKKPDTEPDDLTAIDGIEPPIAAVLHELGVWSFAQIAAWNEANTAWIEAQLGFEGRIVRERWIAQAGVLAEGGGRA